MLKEIILGGFLALKDYIATHILTCLVPAFLLAGGMISFINKEIIINYLGTKVHKLKSFTLAGFASFLVAVCSCTVIPISSGLYYTGAGIGPAFIILWVAPSSNILSLIYTGNIIGGKIVLARVISALLMAFVVGSIMSYVFRKEKMEEVKIEREINEKVIERKYLILLILILISLLGPNYIIQKGPYWKKVIVWFFFTFIICVYSYKKIEKEKIKSWIRETLFFVRMIFPLLLIGVFIVGIIGKILPENWIEKFLGGNSLKSSFFATLIGATTYFATLTEAPFVDTLMKLGMGKGPALALLLTGPGLSLPNWIAISRVFGIKKAVVYVLTIIFCGTIVGWFFGNFILK
ncbi:MAG: permease [Candidatus Omnitrophica bacterium]|nr:permease [Candidatus Omnitrophota bacterium]MCM8806367.1 permease [Candidatus Omnitrophota bacterium]